MARFGTDGVRGDAEAVLTPLFVRRLGLAVVRTLGTDQPILVGRDTRASGDRITADLASGVVSGGGTCLDLGVVPTPVVAFASANHAAPAVMVSASHNPASDNGIKMFAAGGSKLADAEQRAIEAELDRLDDSDVRASEPPIIANDGERFVEGYVKHLRSAVEGRRLDGVRVVIDAANGAASEIAPRVFRRLGAQVVAIHASPDGSNINEGCGSTDPSDLQRSVAAADADLGLAFDGDADRVVAVDAAGEVVDGDQILVVSALDLRSRGRLRGEGVVVTVMSNLGLHHALRDAGITVVTTAVGDRNVVDALSEHGLVLGGEQSGHIIYADHATTGDGLMTGLFLADLVRRSGAPLTELAAAMTRYPQALESVAVPPGTDLDTARAVWDAVASAERELGEEGRVLVRASGTEPLVRVMVEAADAESAHRTARDLAAVVTAWARDDASSS